MKKNKMMRIASVLLVAVLLSTCAISGTFAKYVTSDSGSDTARVAKWGVEISLADDLGAFLPKYETDETGTGAYVGTHTVACLNDAEDLVAPGTKGSMSFTITGTPEVATRITVSASGTPIKLDAGEYTLAAGKFADAAVTVTTTAVYEPIKFYFGTDAITDNTTYDKTLSELVTALEALSKDYDPNATLDETYYIGWSWALENTVSDTFATEPYTGAKMVDFLDTYLGDEDTAQKETFSFTIRVEQID